MASTYVKVRCEGDRGKLKYSCNKEGEAATFEDAVYIFVILHSNAEFLIKVKDDNIGKDSLAACACIRLDRLKCGYRFIHLLDARGMESRGVLLVRIVKVFS